MLIIVESVLVIKHIQQIASGALVLRVLAKIGTAGVAKKQMPLPLEGLE